MYLLVNQNLINNLIFVFFLYLLAEKVVVIANYFNLFCNHSLRYFCVYSFVVLYNIIIV